MPKEFQAMYQFLSSKYLPSYFRRFEEAFLFSFLADHLQNVFV